MRVLKNFPQVLEQKKLQREQVRKSFQDKSWMGIGSET